MATKTRLAVLGLLAAAGFLLGPWTGLFILPLLTGPFFSYAFHLARSTHPDQPADRLSARLVHGLLFAFFPGLLIVAILTSFGAGTLGPRSISLEVFLLFAVYTASATGTALATHWILIGRATPSEKKLFGRMRWPLIISLAWAALFLLLDMFFGGRWSSVDYLAVSSVGLYLGGGILVAWMAMAAFRTFSPAPQKERPEPETGPTVSPVFTSFRGW